MKRFVRFSVPAFVFLAAACGSTDSNSGDQGGDAGSNSSGGNGDAGSATGGESGTGVGSGVAGESATAGETGTVGEGGTAGEGGAGAAGASSGGMGGSVAGGAGAGGSSAGASGAPMLTCSADVTADTSNVGVTHFEVNTAGGVILPQGTALAGTDAQHMRVGLSALQSPGALLQIAVVGAAPASGAKYTTAADLGESINGVANYLGFSVTAGSNTSSWVADAGTVVTTAAVGPGPLSNYKVIQFTFSGAHMTPSMRSNDKATGAFTLSGSCTGAIQYR